MVSVGSARTAENADLAVTWFSLMVSTIALIVIMASAGGFRLARNQA